MWWWFGLAAAALELQVDTLRVGTSVTMEVDGAHAYETTYIVMGGPIGSGPCPDVAGGLCMDIEGPVSVLGSIETDATGHGTLSVALPATVPTGVERGFQAVAIRGLAGADSVKSAAVERMTSEQCVGYQVPGDYAGLREAVDAVTATGGTICLGSGVFDGATIAGAAHGLEIIGVHPDETRIDDELRVLNSAGTVPVFIRSLEAYNIDIWEPGAMPVHVLQSRVVGFTSSGGISVRGGLEIMIDGVVLNNTVENVANYGLWARLDRESVLHYANTIFTGADKAGVNIDADATAEVTSTHNALFDNAANYAGMAVMGPGYVSANCDLDDGEPPTPGAGSPCVDAGSVDDAPPLDFWGMARDAHPDIGAVER